ncbi:hypothetical protein BJY04DRAFT_216320 [Aspergillus karnatakaensis]|uniref:Zn(II)2Cys6 transcription factor n=1 Tax=Aspergillus karnatakaensis TaxID=1810916 RepID=UPI003CCD7364
MDVRGYPTSARPGRPPIARRSCDQCRTRKIGCDRSSPCSNCVSARLDCTHSTVAPRATPKPKLLISTEYEQKMNDVARDIVTIKDLLRRIDLRRDGYDAVAETSDWKAVPESEHPAPGIIPLRDHSAHIIDFVKAVVDGVPVQSGSNEVTASLQSLVRSVEMPDPNELLPQRQDAHPVRMPEVDDVVKLIRWAKSHRSHSRVVWISRILPLEIYEDICRKVFFATSEYTDVDLIIANSFLSYMFAEHAVIYGDSRSRGYCDLCRSTLGVLLHRLPLVLPASMDVIAALTFGSLHSVEQSKVTQAWALISCALSHCQTLGYHRLHSANTFSDTHHKAQQRLFWTVLSYESGLSLRLGRRSGICDSDITLPVDPAEPRSVKVSRIQRKAYDHLYSASSSNQPAEYRTHWAWELSEELRGLINQTRAEISEAPSLEHRDQNPLRTLYLRADMVCHSSLLVLILRVLPSTVDLNTGVDDCVTAARNTLQLHQACLDSVQACKDPHLVTRYITWAILHTPFVPFTVLYLRAVQLLDYADLTLLEAFSASLKTLTGTDTYSRLYELLCQSARMYIDSSLGLEINGASRLGVLGFDGEALRGQGFDNAGLFDAGGWYYGNQLMGVLDDDLRF